MAKLPDIESLGQRPIPQPIAAVSSPRNAGAVGDAVSGIGDQLSKIGEHLDNVYDEQNARKLDLKHLQGISEIRNEVLSAQGEDVGPAVQRAGEKIQQLNGSLIAQARSPNARDALEESISRRSQSELNTFAAHAIDANARVMEGTMTARAAALADSAANNYTNLQAADQDIASLRQQTANFGKWKGLSPEEIAINQHDAESKVRRQIATRLIYEDGHGPDVGRAYVAAHKDAMGPEDQFAVETHARTQEATLAADQRRQMASARSDANSQIDIIKRRLADHDPTLTVDDLFQAQQVARGLNLSSDAYDLGRARIQLETGKAFEGASAHDISVALTGLTTRIAKAGDKASAEDVIRRDYLQSMLGSRQTQDQGDPLGSFASAGGAVTPVDYADQGSIRSRLQAAGAAEKQFGYFRFYRPDEARLMQEQIASGPAGRLQAINEVAAIGAVDTKAAARAAEQVAPNDPVFNLAIRSSPMVRGLIVRGAEARKLIPGSLEKTDGTKGNFDSLAQEWFSTYIAPALSRMDPTLVAGVRESAKNIYAERLRQNGTLARGDFSYGDMTAAANTVLGQNPNGGGMGRWTWGPKASDGNAPGMVLPVGMSEDDFHSRMANLTPQSWHSIANGTPVWSSGHEMTPDDLRRNFVPMAVRDGAYQFVWNGRIAVTKDGRPFELDIRKIGPYVAPHVAPTKKPETMTHPVYIAPPDTPSMHGKGPVYFTPGGK
jgi:hypothetical protein